MQGIAHISHSNGGRALPAKNHYELELLFEYVGYYTNRYGRVHLRINHHQWLVTACDGAATGNGTRRRCVICDESVERLSYQNSAGVFCGPCARRAVREVRCDLRE